MKPFNEINNGIYESAASSLRKTSKLYFIEQTLFHSSFTLWIVILNVWLIFPFDRSPTVLHHVSMPNGLQFHYDCMRPAYRFGEEQFFYLIRGRHSTQPFQQFVCDRCVRFGTYTCSDTNTKRKTKKQTKTNRIIIYYFMKPYFQYYIAKKK